MHKSYCGLVLKSWPDLEETDELQRLRALVKRLSNIDHFIIEEAILLAGQYQRKRPLWYTKHTLVNTKGVKENLLRTVSKDFQQDSSYYGDLFNFNEKGSKVSAMYFGKVYSLTSMYGSIFVVTRKNYLEFIAAVGSPNIEEVERLVPNFEFLPIDQSWCLLAPGFSAVDEHVAMSPILCPISLETFIYTYYLQQQMRYSGNNLVKKGVIYADAKNRERIG